ncbi:MAG: toll/interleukin-1 receptor domain-containing protein [Bacteroidales bacterium]|nr:toll/interleukin-1 receptor domain-containing protein [Bacteroidales bacterium]
MKAYISHQFKDNISGIVNLLNNLEVNVFDSQTDIHYGKSFQKAIKDAIKECDFMVIVYSNVNPNIAFEAGIGVSLKKPIFSIVSEKNNDPDFLFESAYVHALPEDVSKIEFNLRIFLDNIKPKKKTTPIIVTKHKFYGGGYPNYYDKIFSWYQSINNSTEKDYELLFKQIFELYKLSVIQNKFDSNIKFLTDFCIWSDELNNVIGNPILIEIKKEINRNNIDSLKETVLNLVNNNSAESCLVFYESLKNLTKKDLPNSSRYLFIQISDFIEKFKTSDFNESIRKIRNEIVHNQY